jgi:hypothetical protein
MDNMEEKLVELWKDAKIWNKGNLKCERYGQYGRKTSRIMIRYGQYGRTPIWIMKIYEKCGRKVSWNVKWYG